METAMNQMPNPPLFCSRNGHKRNFTLEEAHTALWRARVGIVLPLQRFQIRRKPESTPVWDDLATVAPALSTAVCLRILERGFLQTVYHDITSHIEELEHASKGVIQRHVCNFQSRLGIRLFRPGKTLDRFRESAYQVIPGFSTFIVHHVAPDADIDDEEFPFELLLEPPA